MRDPSADRTIYNPGMLYALLNSGGKIHPQQEYDQDSHSDIDDDNSSSYKDDLPV